MIYTGTLCFVSVMAAVGYYQTYGYDADDVQHKIEAGEIHIGKPSLQPGQRLILNEQEGRYFIEEA